MGEERMIDETMKRIFQSYIISYVDACESDLMVNVMACFMMERNY